MMLFSRPLGAAAVRRILAKSFGNEGPSEYLSISLRKSKSGGIMMYSFIPTPLDATERIVRDASSVPKLPQHSRCDLGKDTGKDVVDRSKSSSNEGSIANGTDHDKRSSHTSENPNPLGTWNESLASASEAAIKADRLPNVEKPTEELQKETIQQIHQSDSSKAPSGDAPPRP